MSRTEKAIISFMVFATVFIIFALRSPRPAEQNPPAPITVTQELQRPAPAEDLFPPRKEPEEQLPAEEVSTEAALNKIGFSMTNSFNVSVKQ